MGTYPAHIPAPAIAVAEPIVTSAVKNRLVKEGWRWKAPRYLLSGRELNEIRMRFAPDVKNDALVAFVGMVFSKVRPEMHYEFVSDGFILDLGGISRASTIVVRELPKCFHGYENPWRQDSYRAALDAVRALMTWKLASYRAAGRDSKWPVGDWGGADLIHGELYRWIKGLGEFGYCRTRNVIEFLYAAAPDLRAEWEADGLTLIPDYHVDRGGRERATTLRLVSATPA